MRNVQQKTAECLQGELYRPILDIVWPTFKNEGRYKKNRHISDGLSTRRYAGLQRAINADIERQMKRP